MSATFGIISAGVYIPRRRLQRSAIHAANSWFAPNLRGLSKGEKPSRTGMKTLSPWRLTLDVIA